MSQVPMEMVKPSGLDTGHKGLGAARELFWMGLEEHFVQHHLPYARHSMAVAFHLLWGVDHRVPGTHAGDIQVDHHHDGVTLGLGPDNVHHGPGIAHCHGHPVEAPTRVRPHVVEFSQFAVRGLVQKLLKPPQKFLQSHQGQFYSSSP
jgi:hypothetical protein